MSHFPEIVNGTGISRPRGECSLVEAVDRIGSAVEYCRSRQVPKLLFNATGLTGISIPTLVDRFLMVEEWARVAEGKVAVVLVVHPEYIHPEKFGVVVAAHLGLTCNVFRSELEAFEWLETIAEAS